MRRRGRPGDGRPLPYGWTPTGHVLGVVAAHDRAVRLFPPARAVAGRPPLLALTVCCTTGGLALLPAA
jgi:hypothetical protein